MKKHILMLIAAAVLLGCNTDCIAQVIATASASATVVTPVGLVKNVDMNFGNAAVSPSAGGSITLAPAGSRSISGTGVTLPSSSGTVAAARFTVSGMAGYTYAITLPSSAVITGPSSATMTLNGFSSAPASTGTLSSGGTQSLTVGATLTVAAAQAAGSYTNATAIPVTVNYN